MVFISNKKKGKKGSSSEVKKRGLGANAEPKTGNITVSTTANRPASNCFLKVYRPKYLDTCMNREEYLKTGIEICTELTRRFPIVTIADSYEGRKNAERIEKEWLNKIKSKGNFSFKGKEVKLIIKESDDRFWVDFAFIYDGDFFPVNFKSGAGRTADNISGLKYIRYLIFYDADGEFQVPGTSEDELARKIGDRNDFC